MSVEELCRLLEDLLAVLTRIADRLDEKGGA
jgi:hypothetical protein